MALKLNWTFTWWRCLKGINNSHCAKSENGMIYWKCVYFSINAGEALESLCAMRKSTIKQFWGEGENQKHTNCMSAIRDRKFRVWRGREIVNKCVTSAPQKIISRERIRLRHPSTLYNMTSLRLFEKVIQWLTIILIKISIGLRLIWARMCFGVA